MQAEPGEYFGFLGTFLTNFLAFREMETLMFFEWTYFCSIRLKLNLSSSKYSRGTQSGN